MDKESIKEAIESFVFDFGFVPLNVRVLLNHGSYEIHFSIFKKANVTLKDCLRVTLALQDFLLVLLGTDDFTLDVSSPGAQRVLKSPLEYSLFAGKKAKLLLVDGTEYMILLVSFDLDSSMLRYYDLKCLEEKDVAMQEVKKCQLTLD
jgi:ribosome maturation factor RimP